MKKSRRMFSLAMLVCLIVGVSTGIRECIGAACALAFVNATLGLEDLEKKMEDKNRVGGGVMLEYNEQTENLMEIAMMLEQLKGESEYLFETLTDIDSMLENNGDLEYAVVQEVVNEFWEREEGKDADCKPE